MCDEQDLANFNWKALNRRQFAGFGAAGAAASLAACSATGTMLEGEATGGLSERTVTFATPDGQMDAFSVHPAGERRPGVLLWPDIAGLREAFMVMARRLANEGYAVLVVNQYYRSQPAPLWTDFAAFQGDNGFQKAGAMREMLGPQAIMRDATAAIAWMDAQEAVDTTRGIGTQGYCMGGPFTVYTAAAVPTRVRAAASLHGGGLLREGEMSPHRLLDDTKAAFLIAIAQNDDEKDPQAKTTLRQAAQAAGVPAEVEVYAADHGWTVLDSPAYDEAAAERAYDAIMTLYRSQL